MPAPLEGLRPGFPSGFPSVHGGGKELKAASTNVASTLIGTRNTHESCENCQNFASRAKVMAELALVRQRATEVIAMMAGTAKPTSLAQ
jgi:hypothetical protein